VPEVPEELSELALSAGVKEAKKYLEGFGPGTCARRQCQGDFFGAADHAGHCSGGNRSAKASRWSAGLMTS